MTTTTSEGGGTEIDSAVPPATDTENLRRAAAAHWVLREYIQRAEAPDTELETGMEDLLGDLMHLADAMGIDFLTALNQGAQHYSAETNPDDDLSPGVPCTPTHYEAFAPDALAALDAGTW